MIDEFEIGKFVTSSAGHDAGKCYVIIQIENEYVYLVDGKIRTLSHPKKKKRIHVKMLAVSDQALTDKIVTHKVKNEEIKRAIKLLQNGNSSKEAM
jgi:ribosomal protein L14E/L6E/L27E